MSQCYLASGSTQESPYDMVLGITRHPGLAVELVYQRAQVALRSGQV